MGIRAYLRRIMGHPPDEPLGETTLIVLQWPSGPGPTGRSYKGMRISAEDQYFVLEGLLHGEPLHERIDLLLEEHSPAVLGRCEEVSTEIQVYWYVEKQWYVRDYLSVMSCS